MRRVIKAALVTAIISALAPFHSSVKPLPNSVKTELKKGGYWHKGCPVGLSDLRVLTVTYRGFDGHNHTGQLVTNKTANRALAGGLSTASTRSTSASATCRSTALRRPGQGVDDPSGSFECRQAVPSPCRRRQRHRQLVQPRLRSRDRPQPVGEPVCGLRHEPRPKAQSYRDRSRHDLEWSRRRSSPRSGPSAGAGVARGRAIPRTTCTSP